MTIGLTAVVAVTVALPPLPTFTPRAALANGVVGTQQAELTASGGAAGDEFGLSAALSSDGNTALIGAPYKTVSGNVNQGAAYGFVFSECVANCSDGTGCTDSGQCRSGTCAGGVCVEPPPMIPTLSTWGIIGFSSLAFAFVLWGVGRSRWRSPWNADC
jgi:hypothetical protein